MYYAVLLRSLKRDKLHCIQLGIRVEQSGRLRSGVDNESPGGGALVLVKSSKQMRLAELSRVGTKIERMQENRG